LRAIWRSDIEKGRERERERERIKSVKAQARLMSKNY